MRNTRKAAFLPFFWREAVPYLLLVVLMVMFVFGYELNYSEQAEHTYIAIAAAVIALLVLFCEERAEMVSQGARRYAVDIYNWFR